MSVEAELPADNRAIAAGPAPRAPLSRGWACVALLIFLCAIAVELRGVLREGVGVALPLANETVIGGTGSLYRTLHAADLHLSVALVEHNARTLTRRPHEIFDALHCAPARSTLTIADPLIAMGFLGIPFELAGAGPVAIYNLALASLLLISCFSMAWLVADWTTVPVAGLAAGLLYTFDAQRLGGIDHTFIYDTSWTLLVLYFARRLLAFGRWRDAVGLALSGSLQLGTSFYAVVAAASAAGPVLVWLLWQHRLRHARWPQLAFSIAVVLFAAWFVFGPYLELRSEGGLPQRDIQLFAFWADFLPGGRQSIPWTGLGLAVAGLVIPSRYALAGLRGNPRPALVIGAFVAAAVSTGLFFSVLSVLVPGLGAVRAPMQIGNGVHLACCVLAGCGVAALVRIARAGAWAAVVQAALLLAVALETLVLPNLEEPFYTGRPYARVDTLLIPSAQESIAFFDRLLHIGNSGPLLELPLETPERPDTLLPGAWRILLTSYHHRRTSACYGSVMPPSREQLSEVLGNFAALSDLGFTTVIVHHASPAGTKERRWLDARARSGRPLRKLLSNSLLAAYAIEPVPRPAPADVPPAQTP